MRHLALTSPEMRGPDVRHLQGVLNERYAHYHSRLGPLKLDGIYGRATVQAMRDVAYAEGLHHYDGSVAVQRLILHPALRNPAEIAEAHRRQQLRNHHATIGAGQPPLKRIVALAERYRGVHEHPDDSNWGYPHPAQWEHEFGFNSGVSWCGCFAGAMIILAGGHVDGRVAFCPYIEADARSKSNGFDLWKPNHNEGVGPGWLVLFNWNGGSEPEHVEIVKQVRSDQLITIGGNTGGHGGEVREQGRPFNLTVGYARPRL